MNLATTANTNNTHYSYVEEKEKEKESFRGVKPKTNNFFFKMN